MRIVRRSPNGKDRHELGQCQDVRRKDGTEFWASLTVALQTDTNGSPLHFISIVSDISERVAAQQHQRLLMSELAHRLKNQLAIVGSIASQSIRDSNDFDDFRDKFGGRLNALAGSIDLLVNSNRGKFELGELVKQTLSPFPGHRTLNGEEVEIGDEASETLALALHELATNATKYGAWSLVDGELHLTWKLIESDEGCRSLVVSWAEVGGPPVSPPTRMGFGRRIIERVVAQKLKAVVRCDYPVEGLRWSLDMPLP